MTVAETTVLCREMDHFQAVNIIGQAALLIGMFIRKVNAFSPSNRFKRESQKAGREAGVRHDTSAGHSEGMSVVIASLLLCL